MRRSSPVQSWLDSIPSEQELENEAQDEHTELHDIKTDDSNLEDSLTENTILEPNETGKEEAENDMKLVVPNAKEMWKRKSLESGVLTNTSNSGGGKKKLQRDFSIQSEGYSPKMKNPLYRDHSLQSDASGSSGSSVLNVLGARKVDAESVLLALGLGPSEKQQQLQRIPERFLVSSKLKGISTEKFIRDEQHSMRMHDCGVFGYRGLTGNPHVPPSTIVAKIIECLLQNDDECREEALLRARHSIADMRPTHQPTHRRD